MSWAVTHAYWHFWQPGKQLQPAPEEQEAYDAYCKRAGRRNSTHRLLLLRLAMDANPIETAHNAREVAVCWTAIDTLAEALGASRRTLQRLIQSMERWGDLEVKSCNGRCLDARYPHHGTNHYYLALPAGAQPWGRDTRKQAKQRAKRSKRKQG